MLNLASPITLRHIREDVWEEDGETLVISFSYSKGPSRNFVRTLEWLDAPGQLTSYAESQIYHSNLYAGAASRMTDEEFAAVEQSDNLMDIDILEIRDQLQKFLSAR